MYIISIFRDNGLYTYLERMRRKIMLHGPSSLIISLPSEWVKKNNLKKGDEIDVIEDDKGLLINPVVKSHGIKKAEITFTGMDDDTQKDVLLTLHKKGYDEVKLNHDNPGTAKNIQLLLNELNIGFEIINQSPSSIVIGNVSNPESEQFDNLFRRVFRIAIEYSRKIHAVMKKKEEITESCFSHKTSISRITTLSKRIVIKENKAYSPFIFSIIHDFETIGHTIFLLQEEIKEINKPVSDELINAFDEVVNLLASSYDLYYNFDLREYSSLRKVSRQLNSKIKECKYKHDLGFCYWEHVESIHNRIDNLLGSTLAINI